MSATISPVQFGNPLAYATAAEFAAAMQARVPPGVALAGVNAADLLAGCAAAFADLHAQAAVLSEVETVPSTTDILLPNWEMDYGLPDCCTPLGASIQERRNALLAKIAQVGGQSEAYFIAVAAALGWTITITRGAIGSWEWTINVAETITPIYFRAGVSAAGDRLVDWADNTQLECVMNQIAPPHTTLNFVYGS
jgi:uncharacterized protein YmfQ (DUF2313 family)